MGGRLEARAQYGDHAPIEDRTREGFPKRKTSGIAGAWIGAVGRFL
ncbi:hypothetical protein Poly24_39430 [Rosistilla carotiformis]|uniref:Uncharacterized protein n=1 Tax=Rosistilla carotiformis TaxID=2528017 RepID=A0A518JXF3_9BACT|nr:hypothetical protein Poly24_39430 [Rosistilla carotiformis]